jgi:hypothetical protein
MLSVSRAANSRDSVPDPKTSAASARVPNRASLESIRD